MKEGGNITVLVLGDEAVGKSSLISTFVSRHFSGQVPGILTRVRLPPDPSLSKCTTTIIDTQNGDATFSNALSLSGAQHRSSLGSNQSSNDDTISSSGNFHGDNAPELAGSESPDPIEDVGEHRRASSETSSSEKYQSAEALLASASPFRNVDAIILVYDLDRIDTFHRLEYHWLPLIEQCYNGHIPVIVAGNKMDTASASNDQNSPSRQQIISLLQQFKFVRQCIKCSAKKLLNVDEVFLKSQQSVLYPISPLYDLNAGKLTSACSKAFTRIFRMFDSDKDGLLSDAELNVFQQKIWRVSLTDKDFDGWKRMATQHDSRGIKGVGKEDTIRDDKFTVAGFLAIFDVLITSQNRLEVPWKVLRSLGYDDELNLNIPDSISSSEYGNDLEFDYLHPDDWRLSSSDIGFLMSTFLLFDSDGDGILSSADIGSIFSVLSTPYPPWSECGTNLCQGCFSLPLLQDEETQPPSRDETSDPASSSTPPSHPSSPSSIISASGITISSSPLPSVNISKDSESLCFVTTPKHKPLSFLSWMNRWHMMHTISPLIARTEMYRLGHDFETKSRRNLHRLGNVPPPFSMPSTFVRALVLGSKNSGKRGLVQKLHRLQCSQCEQTETKFPATSCSVSMITRPKHSCSTTTQSGKETYVHVIVTEVPALDLSNDMEKKDLRSKLSILLGKRSGKRPYDMAMLVFDTADMQSLQYVKDIESNVLTDEMPRVFVGTTSELTESGSEPTREAYEHCKRMDLESPLIVSIGEEMKLDSFLIEHMVSCAQDERPIVVSFRSTPHGEKKQRDAAKRRKVLWIGGLVTAGITVVLGLAMAGKKKNVCERGSGSAGGGWLKFLQNMLPF